MGLIKYLPTTLGNLALYLGLAALAHLGALILKPNRPLVRSIFTGSVRLEYARERHPLWVARLERKRPERNSGARKQDERIPENT